MKQFSFIKFINFRRENNSTLIVDKRNYSYIIVYRTLLLYYILKEMQKDRSYDRIPMVLANRYNVPVGIMEKKINELLHVVQKHWLSYNNKPDKSSCNYFERSLSLRVPISLEILLTYKCNLKCNHCLYGTIPGEGNEMLTEEILNIAAQMEKEKIFFVAFSGGEPTLHKDFFVLLEEFSRRKIEIGLSTNGILLNQIKFIKRLERFNIKSFNISIEGSNASMNDDLRGYGTFFKITKALRMLVNSGRADQIVVKITYGKQNYLYIENIVNLLRKIGIKKIAFHRLKKWGRAKKLKEYIPTYREIEYVNKKILELRTKYPDVIIEGDSAYTQSKVNSCAVSLSLTILPSGDVVPCNIFGVNTTREIILGNVKEQPIKKIWNNTKSKTIRSYVQYLFKSNNYICSKCADFLYCPSPRCIAYNYLSHKKFLSNPYKCFHLNT
ncbi:MAG TPA: radical SAM protein [candidate division WOR-3 bacterium]|uniref:Radical SAM protein n=1 Tax=candidate division WOR-3 bacterium TaxID=2052148 RepID=A0A9C9K0G9_UNCW3|nr:radical SAM protein [candidate division WOR-3 bacterium]